MKFDWKSLTKEDYEEAIQAAKENPKSQEDRWIGQIGCGELRFDVMFRDYSEDGSKMAIAYDCYVANEDTGYGETENGMPYDFAEGTDLYELQIPFEDFRKKTEELLEEFIMEESTEREYSLREKAEKPLQEW